MKNVIVILIFVASFSITFAQSSSPYTRYGIGDIDYSYSPKMIGIGDLGVTNLDQDHLLVSNPASWSILSRTRVELSIGYRGASISDGNKTAFTSETDFKGFTIGFPVSREYGVGEVAGLVPFSRVSYEAQTNYDSPDEVIPSYHVLYEGTGGISKIFIGSSFNLPLGFSAGVTLDYYFGNISYLSSITFENTSNITTTLENNRRSTGFGSTAGIISSNLARDFRLDLFNDLRIGASVNFISELSTDTVYSAKSLFLVDTQSVGSVYTKIPLRITGGLSFAFGDSYNFNFDYSYQPMSSYTFNGTEDNNLRDINKVSAAFEYKAKRYPGISLWEQIIWRFGLGYEQTQYTFYGKGIDQISTFGGFSYPLGIDNSIDIAIQYSMRGTNDYSLLKEHGVKLYVGLSFGELWFLTSER